MPSARPKLVGKGGEPVKSDDVAAKQADNLFVIGGGGSPAASSSNLNSSRSSLSMHVSASGGLDFSSSGGMNESSHRGVGGRRGSATGGRRGSATSGNKKGGSSLARAAKGTFIQDKKPKNKQAVQTSFVVGGGSSSLSSAHQDEKKIEMEDTSARGSSRKSRTVISTSFQIPDNGHASFSGLQQGDHMDVDSSLRGRSGGRRRSSKTSTVQPTAYVIGGSPPPPEPAQAQEGSESMDTTPTSPTTTKATFVVQPASDADDDNREVEKMEGVIDLSEKPPLCVLDGANLAYAYAKAKPGVSSLEAEAQKPEPDTKGIEVACEYFESAGIRVLAVLPQNWTNRENHQKVLKKLEERGVLVEAPSRDDDDAYAITIARREDAKARQRGDGPGYVMSNDMFRDAAARAKEEGGGDDLKEWLSEGSTLDSGKTGPGRISFAFLDTGSLDDHGDKILDLMPNPRHPLIQFVERTRAAAGH